MPEFFLGAFLNLRFFMDARHFSQYVFVFLLVCAFSSEGGSIALNTDSIVDQSIDNFYILRPFIQNPFI